MATKKQSVKVADKKSAVKEPEVKQPVGGREPGDDSRSGRKIVVKKSEGINFEPASDDLHHAVCCEIVELDQVETPFGIKDQLKFIFQIEEMDGGTPNRRKEVRATHTKGLGSASKPSNLRKMLEGWRGRRFTEDEIEEGVDIGKCLGLPLRVQTMRKQSVANPDREYAQIVTYLPPDKTMKLEPLGYVLEADRVKKSETQQGRRPVSAASKSNDPSDSDDLPF